MLDVIVFFCDFEKNELDNEMEKVLIKMTKCSDVVSGADCASGPVLQSNSGRVKRPD